MTKADKVVVRVYNVRFGDAILISVPDRATTGETVQRHILIDFGNALSGRGGVDAVFAPVIDDILARLAGKPLDLYVMTHEHMDHVQGLLFCKERLQKELQVDYAWLTASAEPGYYERFPHAKEKKLQFQDTYDRVKAFMLSEQARGAFPADALEPVEALLFNNSYRDTEKCVDYLRHLAPEANTTYVYRGLELTNRHPFVEAKIEIWAPEEDTSVYYGTFHPLALGSEASIGADAAGVNRLIPPSGVDAGVFYNLVDSRQRASFDALLAIDAAANNTSVVFSLEWRGWRLLFPGDAERRSWKTMGAKSVLQPVHFLKVAHHGSANGTPDEDLLDKLLPISAPDARPRSAAVSTSPGEYGGVPDEYTLGRIAGRAALARIGEAGDGLSLTFEFPEME